MLLAGLVDQNTRYRFPHRNGPQIDRHAPEAHIDEYATSLLSELSEATAANRQEVLESRCD
jgi:hypothetical protein